MSTLFGRIHFPGSTLQPRCMEFDAAMQTRVVGSRNIEGQLCDGVYIDAKRSYPTVMI